jgi:hypothetical protein
MTYQELCAALNLTRKIDRLRARRDEIRESYGHAPDVRVQGGRGVSAAQTVSELSDEIDKLGKQRDLEAEIIRRYIGKLQLDELETKVLVMRYVECRPWHLVGAGTGYSERRVFQIHDAAKKIAVGCS